MISVQQVYDAYPDRDLLPIERPGKPGAAQDLNDIEAMREDIGDTLFLFLCRELCQPDDEVDEVEAYRRVGVAIRDLLHVQHQLYGGHVAKLIATQVGSIYAAAPGDVFTLSLGCEIMRFECNSDTTFDVRIGEAPSYNVGNAYGAAVAYMDMAIKTLSVPRYGGH